MPAGRNASHPYALARGLPGIHRIDSAQLFADDFVDAQIGEGGHPRHGGHGGGARAGDQREGDVGG